jgi:hypothetical protein
MKAQRNKKAKKKCERKKVEFTLFLPPTLETQFQSPKPLGRGKSKDLE